MLPHFSILYEIHLRNAINCELRIDAFFYNVQITSWGVCEYMCVHVCACVCVCVFRGRGECVCIQGEE